ncbi:hypothetical protein V6N12_010938 [Hibiscus sabdariffa]|uniref:Uncharacterized protein n=1 Tax=Hibiscus sabdariffa TaxID=183260 RepID=A0ABR2ELK9_9ROSI
MPAVVLCSRKARRRLPAPNDRHETDSGDTWCCKDERKNRGNNTYLYRRERRMQEHGGEAVRSRLIWTERRRYRTPKIGGAWRKGDWNVARLLL